MMMAPIENPAIAVLVSAIAAQFTAREMLQICDLIAGAAGEKMAEEEIKAEEAQGTRDPAGSVPGGAS